MSETQEVATDLNERDFDFHIAGLSDKDQIIVLVDDYIYGPCSYAIKEGNELDANGHVKLDLEFLQAEDKPVPSERQDAVVQVIVAAIMQADLSDEKLG